MSLIANAVDLAASAALTAIERIGLRVGANPVAARRALSAGDRELAIGEDRVAANDGAGDLLGGDIGAAQIGPGQIRTTEAGAGNVGRAQVGIAQARVAEARATQIGAIEFHAVQIELVEIAAAQIGSALEFLVAAVLIVRRGTDQWLEFAPDLVPLLSSLSLSRTLAARLQRSYHRASQQRP